MLKYLLLFLLLPCIAQAQVPPKDLWKGIIAEAVGEGKEGMYAVCCVYKNRLDSGMTLGCCGLKRKDLDSFVAKQGKQAEIEAKGIVDWIFNMKGDFAEDKVKGATHYENIEAFGMPKWAKNMIITCKIGHHTFFKERR